MSAQDHGRVAAPPGSREPDPQAVPALTGFDPSRRRKSFTADDFRAELIKIMPGYKWVVHRASKGAVRMVATGIQSSGFNRLSTLEVERTIERERPWYKVRSAGFGTRAPWAAEIGDGTLARALRGLQGHYEHKYNNYRALARDLQKGRTLPSDSDGNPEGEKPEALSAQHDSAGRETASPESSGESPEA